jgi:hypothetical protein
MNVWRKAMSANPGNGQTQEDSLPPGVILFFNLIILTALAVLFGRKIPQGCVSSIGVGLSLAIVTLELFHLTWRYLGDSLLNLVIPIGPLKIPIEPLAALFEQLHPRPLHAYVLWTQAFIFLVVAGLLWFPVSSPFSKSDQVPDIRNFLVHYTDSRAETHLPGGLLQIANDMSVLVEVETLAQPDISCTWAATRGSLLPAGRCATQYSTPVGGNRDTLTVLVQSPCKAYQAFAGLHIEIVQTEP